MVEDSKATSNQKPGTLRQVQGKPAASAPKEPFYQDELDVLEAVLKLEKKYGKTFLTDEQREKLEESGRMAGNVERRSNQEQLEQLKNMSGVSWKQAELLVAALRVKLKSEMTKFLGSEGWKTFTEKQKQYVISCYFQLVYGISEYQMTELLAEKGYA